MKFYRYNAVTYEGMSTQVKLEEFDLFKETPKGYWIIMSWDKSGHFKRWIHKVSRKRFAYPTKEEAMTSFKARKRSQIKILTAQLSEAKSALESAEWMTKGKPVIVKSGWTGIYEKRYKRGG